MIGSILSAAGAAAKDPESNGALATADTYARAAACAARASPPDLAVANVRSFGARGNGVDDDTQAILAAMRSLKAGGTVLFPPGRYAHQDIVTIAGANITLAGEDAVMLATNPDRAAIIVAGERSGIRDLTVTAAAPGVRGQSNLQSGIVVKGGNVRIERVKVSNSKSAGIWISGGRDYVITCNDVYDTKSDGIHSTDGATRGIVTWNRVYNSGDDGISVVSYHKAQQASDVTIEDNTVEHIRWGRGISVIGSADVKIRRNHVRLVAMAAGIIVAREASYRTPGARDVLIENNTIIDNQQHISPLGWAPRTGHGAIELNSDDSSASAAVTSVAVSGNRIEGAAFDGVRLLGNVCGVRLTANIMSGIGAKGIDAASNCPGAISACSGNTLDGKSIACP